MTQSADDLAPRRVGVRDVARTAGVSTQTVSRVINSHPGIRDETRRRVLAAMRDLDYRVNNAARALGTSRTRTIGILVSDADMYGPAVGILALEAAARAAGCWITAAYARAGDPASVIEAAQHLSAQGVDGIVVLAPHARTLTTLIDAQLGVPVTALHGSRTYGTDAHGTHAYGRQRDASAVAVAHLVQMGHTRIAHLAGPEDWLEAVARAEGFDSAVAAYGLHPAGLWRGDWSAASGFTAGSGIASVVRADDGPTAVFVANDQMALGLIARLAEHGLSVPDEVSIVGVDDNPDAAYYRPALTTVRLDIGAEAERCIADLIGLEPPGTNVVPVLVRRSSSGPPRAEG